MTAKPQEAEKRPTLPRGKLLKTILVVLVAIIIPLTVVVLQQQQNLSQQAQSSPAVNWVSFLYTTLTGDDRARISVGSSGAQYVKLYLHGISSPQGSDPVVQSYTPTNVSPNTFYFLGKYTGGEMAWIPPTTAGQYHLVGNAERVNTDGSIVGCDWQGKSYTRPHDTGPVTFTGSCTNAGIKSVTIAYPTVSSIQLNPSSGFTVGSTVSMSVSGNAAKRWLYLHSGPNYPSRNDPVLQSYSYTGSLNNNTFYKFAEVPVATNNAPTTSSVTLPSGRTGTMYIVANAHSHTKGGLPWHQYDRACAWDARVYLYDNTGTVDIGAGCSNSGPVAISVASPTAAPTNTPVPTGTPVPTATGAPTPTNTPVPGSTLMTLYLLLHGVGAAGDSVNPYGPGNLTPKTRQRTVQVQIVDGNNAVVAEKTGTVDYSDGPGYFAGTIDLAGLVDGVYSVKVKTDRYLRRKFPTNQTINNGQIVQMPQLELVAGDANGDNALNILDYNILLDCYSDLAPPIACSDPAKKLSVDFDDDGNVNGVDYNLFSREISVVQFGD